MMGKTSGPMKVTNMVVQPSASGFEGTFVTATETLKSADVDLKQTITLPNWVESTHASPEEQASWNMEMSGLKTHEMGHAKINREEAEKLDKALPGTSATAGAPTSAEAYKKAGGQLTQKLNQTIKANDTENGSRQQDYDKRTDHGRNQGADKEK
jgi:predicted secreted Zn-dependent protease